MSQGQRPALQTRSRETRDKLVAALETCLQSKRFDAISVADIAREAGLAVGTVYRRFENKDAFIPVLFELFRIRLNESYGDAGGLEIDPEQGLKPALHTITTTSWSFLIAQQHLARETLLYARLRPDLVGKEWDDLLAVGQASFVSLALAFPEEVKRDPNEAGEMLAYFFNTALNERAIFGQSGVAAQMTMEDTAFLEALTLFAYGYLTTPAP